MAEHKYDIFISYRRDGGRQFARILQLMLVQRGYRVFLDYDELTDGIFSEKIVEAIKDAPMFMIVLSKGSMVRCANEGDWVRREITLAIEEKKHIIPVNPDNEFDGFPEAVPSHIKDPIGMHQHSEISFGQALGATIDLMIKNRIVPTLGERNAKANKDEDYETAKETLRKQDAHNRFMKKMGIAAAIAIIAIVAGTCFWFWKHQMATEQQESALAALDTQRKELEKKHESYHLVLSPGLTINQMNTIDTILVNMSEVKPDSLWISQFEFTAGQWYGILGGEYDEKQKFMPMTGVSYGEICMMLLDSLRKWSR